MHFGRCCTPIILRSSLETLHGFVCSVFFGCFFWCKIAVQFCEFFHLVKKHWFAQSFVPNPNILEVGRSVRATD